MGGPPYTPSRITPLPSGGINVKISWKIYGQHHPPSKRQNTPRGKGGYTGGGIGGTPHIRGV